LSTLRVPFFIDLQGFAGKYKLASLVKFRGKFGANGFIQAGTAYTTHSEEVQEA
jgi:hypothetical protein